MSANAVRVYLNPCNPGFSVIRGKIGPAHTELSRFYRTPL